MSVSIQMQFGYLIDRKNKAFGFLGAQRDDCFDEIMLTPIFSCRMIARVLEHHGSNTHWSASALHFDSLCSGLSVFKCLIEIDRVFFYNATDTDRDASPDNIHFKIENQACFFR